MFTNGEKKYIHSPDPHYREKMKRVQQCVRKGRSQETVSTFYLDEFTFYNKPNVNRAWATKGKDQFQAPLGFSEEKKCRVVGAINVNTGKVEFMMDDKIGKKALKKFWQQIKENSLGKDIIYLIMDNWPVHFVDDVVEKAENLGLKLIRLPTYAPWTNPIEKLWLWLKRDILFLHRNSSYWIGLKNRVKSFLNKFDRKSEKLLRYTGLGNNKIPATDFLSDEDLPDHPVRNKTELPEKSPV